MTTVEYVFSIGDEVFIKDLTVNGHVIGLFTGQFGNEYEIAYFYDGALRKEYLFEFMLGRKTISHTEFVPKRLQ
jgi:hypothetical protein